MNDLNSILLEGKVSNIESSNQMGLAFTIFSVTSTRYPIVDGEAGREETTIRVRTGGKLAEYCARDLCDGRGIRAVGRIGMHGEQVILVAEHIEFKPTARSLRPVKTEEKE